MSRPCRPMHSSRSRSSSRRRRRASTLTTGSAAGRHRWARALTVRRRRPSHRRLPLRRSRDAQRRLLGGGKAKAVPRLTFLPRCESRITGSILIVLSQFTHTVCHAARDSTHARTHTHTHTPHTRTHEHTRTRTHAHRHRAGSCPTLHGRHMSKLGHGLRHACSGPWRTAAAACSHGGRRGAPGSLPPPGGRGAAH